MFVDSHCHINFPEFQERMPEILEAMRTNDVTHALCVCVTLEDFGGVKALADSHANIYASVGVHPDYEDITEPTIEGLVDLARDPRVVAIGETGLDYFRLSGDLEWQRERFRLHIRAAREAGKPLIVHTRSSAEDTIRILAEEGAEKVGGVMHCFTESWEVAQAAMELGFHISLSGIVTFKNARVIHDVAERMPLERLLIETDSPYLAPVPFRGKTNEPAFVKHVAARVAQLKGIPIETVGEQTSNNFFKLFNILHR